MRCPYCNHEESRVLDTTRDSRGGIGVGVNAKLPAALSTIERPILATPMIIKKDGSREEFARDKLLQGYGLHAPNALFQQQILNVWWAKLKHGCSN